MAIINHFTQLEIWQEAMTVCEEVYRLTEAFPKQEQFTLVSQMRRAAISAPSNIAEGFLRRHGKEFKHFISIALGSVGELETQILLSVRLKYMSQSNADVFIERLECLSRRTNCFYRGIKT